jgi:FtsP/CotA-like multicopper oxidase with cupredoxin domain
MPDRTFGLDRRELVAALGAMAMGQCTPGLAFAQRRQRVTLEAKAAVIAPGPNQPEIPIWALQSSPPGPFLRFGKGDELEIAIQNSLPIRTVPNWYGLDGLAAAEPLITRSPLMPPGKETLAIPMRQAGTFFCDLRLLGDSQARPMPVLPLIVAESESVAVDRDEVLLIEEWRLRPDGTPMAPGLDPKDAVPLYTVNGRLTLDIPTRPGERLRFRFISGCQRTVIALKIEGYEVRVMALDGEPAEPFIARNGAILLPPGGRVDAFIDIGASSAPTPILLHNGREARSIGRVVVASQPPLRPTALPPAPPLPSNGLPAQIDLKSALRFDLTLGGGQTGWIRPENFAASAAPAFRAKAGRPVVLALINRGEMAATFHLHGHHFRLLDRLDDGWKPFWLDTIAIDSGQTQRIAFAADHVGSWLMETMATDWAAPRLVRRYSVE